MISFKSFISDFISTIKSFSSSNSDSVSSNNSLSFKLTYQDAIEAVSIPNKKRPINIKNMLTSLPASVLGVIPSTPMVATVGNTYQKEFDKVTIELFTPCSKIKKMIVPEIMVNNKIPKLK